MSFVYVSHLVHLSYLTFYFFNVLHFGLVTLFGKLLLDVCEEHMAIKSNDSQLSFVH